MYDDENNGWSKLDWFFFILILIIDAVFFIGIKVIPRNTYEQLIATMLWFYGTLVLWCVY